MKRALCTNRVPSTPGGGTVTFVNNSDVDFVKVGLLCSTMTNR